MSKMVKDGSCHGKQTDSRRYTYTVLYIRSMVWTLSASAAVLTQIDGSIGPFSTGEILQRLQVYCAFADLCETRAGSLQKVRYRAQPIYQSFSCDRLSRIYVLTVYPQVSEMCGHVVNKLVKCDRTGRQVIILLYRDIKYK